jgi:hypothetical protein
MTDDQINAAIAEACGWREASTHGGSGYQRLINGILELRPDLPNYANCYETLCEAKLLLTNRQLDYFHKKFKKLCSKKRGEKRSFNMEDFPTTRQMAKLFLEAFKNGEKSEMTDNQINQRIAEVCGIEPNSFRVRADIPDYCNDLNAMHEAEKYILDMHDGYGWHLSKGVCFTVWHATARQRAEAFLRLLEKWEEVK